MFRVNLSHCNPLQSKEIVKNIRTAEKMAKRPLAILADLAGPKIRIGKVKQEGSVVKSGDKIIFTTKNIEGLDKALSLNFPYILKNLKKDAEIYLGDGIIALKVERQMTHGIVARVIGGGALHSRMSFSAHGSRLKDFILSPKDRQDITIMAEAQVDALGISFIQKEEDIKEVRSLLAKTFNPLLIAKIETTQAVQNAASIIEASDGIMVARGDLGFAIPIEEVPHIQKQLITLALRKAKPVITATQMLESMIFSHFPTRAEVTDVANAILDGTDAVMLSAETAMGKFPKETVEMMGRIINASVPHLTPNEYKGEFTADAIGASVVSVASQVKAKLIIVFTQSGSTARRIARHHPLQPIIALSPDPITIRQLNFSWGVHSLLIKATENVDQVILQAREIAKKNTILPLKRGQQFVISAGIPFGRSGTTNFILVQTI